MTDLHADDALIASGFERLYEGLRRLTPRDGLSLTASSTLRRLERSGPQRLCDLHAPEGVSQPAMTQLVTRLEKEGLAQRGSDPADGRVVVVSITDAGRAAVTRRRQGHAVALAERLDRLPAGDRTAILAALPAMERLGDLIAEQPQPSSPAEQPSPARPGPAAPSQLSTPSPAEQPQPS